jgi:hypothetical protein
MEPEGTLIPRGEELITCNICPGDLQYPAEVPLSSIKVCAGGKSCIDHINESASMAKNLIMSYEQKLANVTAKKEYYKAQLTIRESIEKKNIQMFEAQINEKDELLSYLVETYEEQDDLILQQFDSTVNALTDENTKLKTEIAEQADEISQLEGNTDDCSLELRDEIEGLKEKNAELEAVVITKDDEIQKLTEQLTEADLKVSFIAEETKEQNDTLLECYAVSGCKSVDDILEVLTQYNKQNHLKLIFMEKSRNFKKAHMELKSASKSVQEGSKEIDPPGFSDVVSIETCSNSQRNYLKREKKRQKIAMYKAAFSASGCASPSCSAAISSRRPTSEIEGEN